MRQLTTLLLLSLFILGCTEDHQQEKLFNEIENLKSINDSLTNLLNEKQNQEVLIEEHHSPNHWYNEQYDGKQFIRNGIKDPEEYIKQQLRARPELIPIKAVLGGTMSFGRIQLLSHEWLITDFDDGHILGKAIFKYRLNDKQQLEFELLSSSSP